MKNKWISVEECFPEPGKQYLCTDGEDIEKMMYFGTYKGNPEWSSYNCNTIDVTHWRELTDDECNDNPRYSVHVYDDYIAVFGWLTSTETRDLIDMYAIKGYVYVTRGDGEMTLKMNKEI